MMTLGHIVCGLDGRILESSGDFEADPESAANTVMSILRETRLVLKSAPMKRIEIASGNQTVLVTAVNDTIHIKRIANGSA